MGDVANDVQQSVIPPEFNPAQQDQSAQPTQPTPVPVQAQPTAQPAAGAPAPAASAQPGSFAEKLGSALQDAIATPAGAATAQNGGFLKLVLAASADALAPAKPAPPRSTGEKINRAIDNFFAPMAQFEGAPIAGAGKVAAADLARMDAEEKRRQDASLAQSREQREKLQFGLNVALANSQMLHSQYLVHKAGVDEMNANIADNEKTIATLKNQPAPAEVMGTNLTSDDLQRGIALHATDPSKGYDMSQMTPYLTGKVQVGTDENGIPQYRGTYTLVKLPPTVKITDPSEAKALVPDLSDEDLKRIDASHPITLDGATYNGAKQRLETEQAAKAAAQKAADEAAIAAGDRAQKIESMKFAGADIWARDLATVMKQHKDWSYPEQIIGAYRELQANPPLNADGSKQFPNLENDIAAKLGEKNFNNIQTAAEQSRHNREEEQNKRTELSMKKAENDFINPSGSSGLNGEAYLQTLPQPHRDLLASIAEGRNTKAAIQNRKGELTPLGLAVMQAFPDFDVQKAAKYGDTLKEYQSAKNGTAGGSLNAGATALKHLAQLKAINDAHPLDVRIHGTEANAAYNNLLDTVADELVTFYNEPKTNETIASKKSTLGGLRRDAAILEQAKAMGAKFQSLQQTWDNASPRPSFRPPMPYIDNEARTALQRLAPDFVAANPQFAPQQKPQTQPQPALPPAPAGTVNIRDSRGGYHNIPQANLDAARQRDPKLQVIQ